MLLLDSNQQRDVFNAVHQKLSEISARLFINRSALWLLAALWLVEWLWALWAGITLKDMGPSVSIVMIPLLIGLLLDALQCAKRCAQFAYYFAFWIAIKSATLAVRPQAQYIGTSPGSGGSASDPRRSRGR